MAPVAAQSSVADSAMKLNRAGPWEQAAQLARVGSNRGTSADERCSSRVSAVYALTRMGALAIAADELKTFDAQCSTSAVVQQQGADLASIRRELAIPALPKTGMDFSAVDQFWHIADLLVRDAEPSAADWQALVQAPGYRLVMRILPTTRVDIETALRPSRRALFDSLTKRPDDRANILRHIATAATHRAELTRYRDSITKILPVKDAVALTAKFLPPHGTETMEPPLVAFAIFRDDAYSLGPEGVVIDLDHLYREGGLTLLLAHEFHHSYLSMLSKIERPPNSDPATPLIGALSNMRNEGIADLIDKPYPLSYPNSAAMSAYAKRYNEAYARTPDVILAIDSALVRAADDSTQLAAAGRRVQTLLPSSGHYNGSYIAREIYETFGVDSLFPGVYSPFALLRTYAAAEAKRGNPPPFSPKALRLMDALEQKYRKP